MSTTIDTIQIEIESASGKATTGVHQFAMALKELKSNKITKTTVDNLKSLSDVMRGFSVNSDAARTLTEFSNAMAALKKVGSINSLSKSLAGLKTGVENLRGLDTSGIRDKASALAAALNPLSNIKSGGFNSIVNGLLKIDKVVEKLDGDDDTIGKFATVIGKLDEKIADSAPNVIALGNALKSVNSVTGNLNVAFNKTNVKVFNLSNAINVLKNGLQHLKNIANKLRELVENAIEWDGISARFGRGFGDQAKDVYSWVKRLNEEMNINTQMFMQYSSIYATMLTGYGVAAEDAAKMALGYTELTYDIWAGYNDIYKSFSDAADAVKSAIAGEVEPIRRAGFTIVEATLKQTAANHGLEISISNATEAQKSYLRYLTLIDQAYDQNLVGTYAAEMNTAEGVVRTFSQQLKSLAQTAGSLFLPLLVKGIPYLQAFLELLTDAVHKLAGFFGVTIQDVDWSGYNSGVNDAVTETEDLAKAVEAVKSASIGIDELNVISESSTKSSGASSSTGFENIDVDSLWNESIFDAINSHVDELKENVKEFLSPLMDIGTYLWQHKDTVLTIAATIGGFKLLSKVKTFWNGIKKLKIAKTVLSSFKKLKTNGATTFSALTGSVTSLKNSLTGVQKASIVGVSAILEFTAIKDSVKSLSLGCEDVAANLVTIGVAVTGAATAMYFALGPTGLAVAAVVGLLGCVTGLYQANQELISQYIDTTVFDGYGFAISKITTVLDTLWESTTENTSVIMQLGEKIAKNDEIMSTSQSSISEYMGELNAMGALTTENAESMKSDVSSLAKAIKENIGYNAQLVFEAFSNVSKETAKQLGLDVDQMTTILSTFKNTFSAKTAELESTAQGYLTRLASGEILDESEIADLENTLKYLNDMSGQTYANQQKIKEAMSKLTQLDFGNIKTSKKAISDIADLGKQMYTDLDKAFGETKIAIDTLKNQAKTMFDNKDLSLEAYNSFVGVMQNYETGITASYEAEKENIQNQLDTTFGYIESQINQAAVDCYNNASWDDLNWWQKIWNKDQKTYASQVVATFNHDIAEPLYTSLATARENVGLSSSSLGKATYDGFHNAVIEAAHKKDAWGLMEKEAKNAINGYIKGIEANKDSATKAFGQMTQDAIDIVAATQDSHSPAKEYIKLAKDAVAGYVLGVKDNISSVKAVWHDGLIRITKSIEELLESITVNAKKVFKKSTWEDFADNVTNALSEIKMPKFEEIQLTVSYQTAWLSSDKKKIVDALGLEGWPTLKFADSGGIFNTGSLVWAGERGPEIVANAAGGRTGVMNVQQMQDAMYESVYAAVVAAMRATNGGNGETAVRVLLDSKEITAAVEKRQRERGADIMGKQVYSY